LTCDLALTFAGVEKEKLCSEWTQIMHASYTTLGDFIPVVILYNINKDYIYYYNYIVRV